MPLSPIRKLVPLANAAKARGVKVYHLNIGQPDLPTMQAGLDSLKRVNRKILEYSPSEGILPLREKLLNYYHRFKINVDLEDIIVTTGGSEAVLFAFMSCLNPGDELIVPEPAYANYMSFAIVAGAVIKSVPTSIEEGFALPPLEEFEKLITPRTKGILICNPNNPTGYLYTMKEMKQLRDIVKKHDLYLFSDEVYREFCYTGIMKFCQARLSPPLLGQIVAEASIDADPEYMLDSYNEYVERRKYLVDGLNRIDGVYSPIPMGAFYTMVKLPVDDAEKFCAWCLSDFQFEGCTVMMAPGAGFYVTPGMGKNEVRMAYVLNKDDLKHALIVLQKALSVYQATVMNGEGK